VADAGVRYGSGLTAAYAGSEDASRAVNSGINTTSRFGFRGSKDLGGGLKATFNLDTDASATANTRKRTLGMGGTVPLGASVDLILAHYQVKRARTTAVEDDFNRSVAFLEYTFSKRTRAYAELDQTHWKNGYQGAGFKSSASGASARVVNSF
jgi:predicted porin